MIFTEHKSLLALNTFQMDCTAKYFTVLHSEEDLLQALEEKKFVSEAKFILGGGSNILLTKHVDGLVIQNCLKGIEKVHEDEMEVHLKFQGGESWHACVLYCIEKKWAGIENLSLIPGTIGAAPIQNIGAYGVELTDVFVELEAIHLKEKAKQVFKKADCQFAYRNSVFKQKEKGNYFITSVTLRLKKQPVFHTGYGHIQEQLEKNGIKEFSIKAISDAVIAIRQSKLPDPGIVGNAGSFFKNPVITPSEFDKLKTMYPTIPSYETDDGVKIPAAWLIEHCGPEEGRSWKGYRQQNFGVHDKQALCLVNYGGASGSDLFELSSRIITSVQHSFNILLEREVNIW